MAETLAYDPLGRLNSTSVSLSGATATVTQFLYDGDRLVGEYDASGAQLARYVHGSGVDEPLVSYNAAGNARTWLHADRQGSIIAFSSQGTVTSSFAYGPYGEPQAWGGSRFAYTGQIQLPEAQLYHYKARAYDPASGRFLQTDPVGYKSDIDLYAYVGDDPTDKTDPTGNNWEEDAVKVFESARAAAREALRLLGVPVSQSRSDVKDSNGRPVPLPQRQQTTVASNGRTTVVVTPHPRDDNHPDPHVHAAPAKQGASGAPVRRADGSIPYKNGGTSVPYTPRQVTPPQAKQVAPSSPTAFRSKDVGAAIVGDEIIEIEEDIF